MWRITNVLWFVILTVQVWDFAWCGVMCQVCAMLTHLLDVFVLMVTLLMCVLLIPGTRIWAIGVIFNSVSCNGTNITVEDNNQICSVPSADHICVIWSVHSSVERGFLVHVSDLASQMMCQVLYSSTSVSWMASTSVSWMASTSVSWMAIIFHFVLWKLTCLLSAYQHECIISWDWHAPTFIPFYDIVIFTLFVSSFKG